MYNLQYVQSIYATVYSRIHIRFYIRKNRRSNQVKRKACMGPKCAISTGTYPGFSTSLLQVRVKAVPNGETKERAVVVFGATMEEVCAHCFDITF